MEEDSKGPALQQLSQAPQDQTSTKTFPPKSSILANLFTKKVALEISKFNIRFQFATLYDSHLDQNTHYWILSMFYFSDVDKTNITTPLQLPIEHRKQQTTHLISHKKSNK